MRHAPIISYSGLSIILSEASRFDKIKLISGWAGQSFEGFLHPISRFACDIRDLHCAKSILEGTRVVLLLGQRALSLYKQDVSLNEQRGSPFIINDVVFIATYAPQDAYDIRNYDSQEEDESESEVFTEKGHQKTKRKNWRFWLYNDVRKAVRILKSGIKQYRRYDKYLYPSIIEATDALKNQKNSRLFVDIETDKQFNLTCLGFGIENLIYVIPIKRYNNTLAYEPALIYRFFQALAISFRDNVVIAHNSIFDLFVLAYKYKVPFPRNIFDTLLAWHRLFPEVEKSLGHLISFLTDLTYHKSEGIFNPQNHAQEHQLWEYNAKDVETTIICYDELQPLITKYQVGESVKQANDSIRPYLTMMYKGIRINTEAYLNKFNELEARKEQLERCLKIITQRSLNPRSPLQVKEYLYIELGLPEPSEDPTDEKNLLKLLIKHPLPSIRLILAIRGIGKLSSSLKFRLWNNKFDSCNFERLTCAYNIAGANTFRLSSRALLKFKPDKGFGTNVQNWDDEKRRLCIPDKGKIFGQCDQAGAEALVVAYLCRYGRLRELFINKIKSHVYVAMHIYKDYWAAELGLPNLNDYLYSPINKLNELKYWSELSMMIKKDFVRYYIGKKVCHSANYSVGPITLQLAILKDTSGALALSVKECKELLGSYHNIFPEIRQWHIEIQEELKKTRVLKNLFNFPHQFHQPFGEELWKAGYAFIPQSTVGTITNIAITRLQQRLDDNDKELEGLDLLANGHDSILYQFPPEKQKIIKEEVKKEMKVKLKNNRGEEFTMEVETNFGLNWGKFHLTDNPEGLK